MADGLDKPQIFSYRYCGFPSYTLCRLISSLSGSEKQLLYLLVRLTMRTGYYQVLACRVLLVPFNVAIRSSAQQMHTNSQPLP